MAILREEEIRNIGTLGELRPGLSDVVADDGRGHRSEWYDTILVVLPRDDDSTERSPSAGTSLDFGG
jgi:hypothetical protein